MDSRMDSCMGGAGRRMESVGGSLSEMLQVGLVRSIWGVLEANVGVGGECRCVMTPKDRVAMVN